MSKRKLPFGLKLLHEDRDLLVVDKPPGLLSMGTPNEAERTAYWAMTDYVRKGAAKSSKRVWIVHRLDRETSGLLLLAKTEQAKRTLQDNWGDAEKTYLAVVHGHLAKSSGEMTSYLAENAAHRVFATRDKSRGKFAHTTYTVLKEAEGMSLVEVNLVTGRKNQIRVHFADAGHPVVGDQKYGEDEELKRLALHAKRLVIPHPHSREVLKFEAATPRYLGALLSAG